MRPKKLPKMNREEIEDLLDSESICRIAFRGDEYPYMAPFQYVRHGGALYFHFTDYGRKMRLLETDSNVCVGVESLEPDLSEYRFVALSGTLERVDDARERSEALRLLSEAGREGLSQNFLAAHGFGTEESWSALSDDAPLVIYKLSSFTDVVGLRSPYQH
ncbi:MAG: pyridoxamine 5'-phosphate oxidase family protein [Candidatus Bathyarchaeota archaeon]|jgi:nitroimidazol reductase NimA-like FMN-containing flavoprotein (pyridoxamine 5'-phosphate oxidase superfamily)|nr:pyridoxamine 5'-phosphate oxidase family protein [Candidatus Bathyarchaeota archaeon]